MVQRFYRARMLLLYAKKLKYNAAVRLQRHMKGYRVQRKYLFPVSQIKMDATLEPFFALQREINYVSGCLIYYHYKVYKRVKARKKEEAKKKKAKAAAAKKKKGRGNSFRSISTKTTATPAPPKARADTVAKKPGEKGDSINIKTNMSATMQPEALSLGESIGATVGTGEGEGDN